MKITLNKISPQFSFILIFLTGNFLLFINGGVFWDDWTLYNMSFDGLKQQFAGNGFLPGAYLHYFLNQIPNPPLLYHTLTVILQIAGILLIWDIIKLMKLKSNFFFWVILLFSASPFFVAKTTMICFIYVIGNFLFFLAFWLMQKYILNKKILCRILSLIFFLCSFFVNSYLFFYILPFTVLFVQQNHIKLEEIINDWKKIFSYIKIKKFIPILDFIAIPFVFWAGKMVFMQTSGIYAMKSYNKITPSGLILSPLKLLQGIYESVLKLPQVLGGAVVNYYMIFLFIILFIVICFLSRRNKLINNNKISSKQLKIIFLISIGLIIIAVFPYALIGKIPVFYTYDDRHQLLMPLGVSLFTVSLIYFLVKTKYKNYVLIFILCSFIISNINFNSHYIYKWIKNEAIINYFQKANFNNETIIFEDNTDDCSPYDNSLRFYELCGMYKLTSGNETNLFLNYETYKKLDLELFSEYGIGYNMSDYKSALPTKVMIIEKGTKYGLKKSLISAVYKYLAPERFKNEISNFLKISLKELDKNSEEYKIKYLNIKSKNSD